MKVIITGGSGFLAQHLIKHLQENASDIISEIRTIDRKPCIYFLSWLNRIPIKHFTMEISNLPMLEQVLEGAEMVIHLAKKSLEFISNSDEKRLIDAYWQDNFYAELLGRNHVGKKLSNGEKFHAHFLRPTFIYGEGCFKLINVLKTVCESNNGTLPFAEGSSRGMLQFVYAGNVAGFIESSMRNLIVDPDWCNGEYFYCMDETKSHKFKDFISPILKELGYQIGQEQNFYLYYVYTYCADLLRRYTGVTWFQPGFTNISFRFLFGYSLGFLCRKHDLLFKFRPTLDHETHIEKVVDWLKRENLESKVSEFGKPNQNERITNVLRKNG